MAITNPRSETKPAPAQGSSSGPPAEPSVIARGTILTGDCQTDGALRIDGHVKGAVRANQLTVGSGGRVDGDVETPTSAPDRTVVVEGRVGGSVHAHRVDVAPGGSIGSGLKANQAFVRGRVTGAIEAADRLILAETAVIEGNVTASRLGLHDGGRVHGTVRIGTKPDRAHTG